MPKNKRWNQAKAEIKADHLYPLEEALELILNKTGKTRFDESLDVAARLGVDPKQSDQQIRGAVALPHGIGKEVKVLVFAKGPQELEAKKAKADYVGAEDLIEKIKGGWLEFDKAIAIPSMMAMVSRVAKILGPRGLMPNPKLGTVTMKVAEAVSLEKKGKKSFRMEKAGIVHASIGRLSMGLEKLMGNYEAFFSALLKAKPSSSKGVYLKSVSLSSTMGPGVPLDISRHSTLSI